MTLATPPFDVARATREGDALVERALVRAASGDLVGALTGFRSALEVGASRELVARVRPVLDCLEGRSLRPEPPPPTPPVGPSAAWARAWAKDLDGARRLAESEADDASRAGLLGVVELLEGRPKQAIPLLDRAIAAGGGEHLVLHRVRALVQIGRLDEARRALAGLGDGESLSRRVLMALVESLTLQGGRRFRKWVQRVRDSEAHLNCFFSNDLPAAVGAAAASAALSSPQALTACLEDLLDRMAGNLGRTPTIAAVGPDGSRRFVPLEVPPTPRSQAVSALHGIRHTGVAVAERTLTALAARYPRSVQVRTYRGELLLWLGRYDEAWSSFVAAREIEPAPWADIGMFAVLVMTGSRRRARIMAFVAARTFQPSLHGTLPVYRGVLRRRLGEIDAAIDDLTAALAAKPTRLGARMELCVALRAAGRHDEAAEHAATILRDGAPLLVDAADALGVRWHTTPARLLEDDVLEEALRAMRGNRSSAITTWIDGEGTVRIVPTREDVQTEAQRALAKTS